MEDSFIFTILKSFVQICNICMQIGRLYGNNYEHFLTNLSFPNVQLQTCTSRKGPGKPEASWPAGRYNAKFDKPNDLLDLLKITDESDLEIFSESYVRYHESFLCKNLNIPYFFVLYHYHH